LLRIDHERLTYQYGGRDYRLADVYGEVAWKNKILCLMPDGTIEP
jgi:hypothetical protein